MQVWLDYVVNGLSEFGYLPILGIVNGRFHDADAYLKQYPTQHVIKISNSTNTHWGRINALTNAILESDADLVVNVNIADSFEATEIARRRASKPIRLITSLHGLEPEFFADLRRFSELFDGVLVTNRLTERLVNQLVSCYVFEAFFES